MVDRWKKEVKLYNNNNLPLLGIKQFGPTFSGSGPFAYSHLHTSIKKIFVYGTSREFPEVVDFCWNLSDDILFPNNRTKRSKKCGKRQLFRSLKLGPMFCSILIIV